MSSRNSKRSLASRKTAGLVLAGILFSGFGLTAAAQSAGAGSNDSVEGTWRAQLTVRDCQTGVALRTFPAMFAFAKGGTLTDTSAGQLPSLSTSGLGVWHHMNDHTYSAVSETFFFSAAGAWTTTHRLTRLIQVDHDGKSYTDIVTLEIFDTNGNLLVTGCGTTLANRLE